MLELAAPLVDASRSADGSLVLRSRHALGPVARHVCEALRAWAAKAPDRTLFAERAGDGTLRTVGYAEAKNTVDRYAQAMLDLGLDEDTPVMILSENGIDHALVALAAMQAGAAASPISTAYSTASRDLEKLRAIFDVLRPGLVFAADGAAYARAIASLPIDRARVVTRENTPPHGIALSSWLGASPTPAMEARYASLADDAIAKVLFTSGSTGEPKGVINTQRMLCSNQAAITTAWPFLLRRPPRVVDWLPWSHTFGGNHNFNMVLTHGGTLIVDAGRPTEAGIGKTIENLREVSPTMYFNVPRGFEVLAPHLEKDEALNRAFFRDLDVLFYAAASLPNALWERYEALAIKAKGSLATTMLSAWGSTETSPLATTVHFPIRRAGVIGLPAPGVEIKLAPAGHKRELRVRGPNVTPGYFRRPDLAKDAFDEEGFFKMGDAGRLEDEDDPSKGIVFDGRIAEDFKLASGTWVHTGALRAMLVGALLPHISDAVIAGLDRQEIGLLLFATPGASKDEIRARLTFHNAAHPESSRRVGRALLMSEPPSIDAGEITDKGYINQRAVLSRRADLVERLYRDEGDDLIVL